MSFWGINDPIFKHVFVNCPIKSETKTSVKQGANGNTSMSYLIFYVYNFGCSLFYVFCVRFASVILRCTLRLFALCTAIEPANGWGACCGSSSTCRSCHRDRQAHRGKQTKKKANTETQTETSTETEAETGRETGRWRQKDRQADTDRQSRIINQTSCTTNEPEQLCLAFCEIESQSIRRQIKTESKLNGHRHRIQIESKSGKRASKLSKQAGTYLSK